MPKIPLMDSFHDFKINKQLHFAIEDLGYDTPTEIQAKSFAPIGSGKDVVGIAQTGTGKTFAYMLPLISGLKFSKQIDPRILVLVPTRELVLQVVDEIKKFIKEEQAPLFYNLEDSGIVRFEWFLNEKETYKKLI